MHNIDVAIVYATAEQQWIFETQVARGTSAGDLLMMSGFLQKVPDLDGRAVSDLSLGVYAQKVTDDHLLQPNDRVEIYRPLLADPKEVRRQLALVGKTMGKN
ncbi:RnfH family protein [Arenicella xantha]|uniref:UPF0125 protein DFR28_10846 n=1 Tax=Arenicella xantha TaxID=644221 RepID=A0A395JG37_9GAMM|nr:RnfH family protein [Arenicella xantha]RBP48317.1 hypothetical protein DFR28_10846 [Arenicella xantha]